MPCRAQTAKFLIYTVLAAGAVVEGSPSVLGQYCRGRRMPCSPKIIHSVVITRPPDAARDQSGIAAPGLADAATDNLFSVRCPQ